MKTPDRSVPQKESGAPDSKTLDRLYDAGYFHGETSGYPMAGYRVAHPDWKAWLDFIGLVKAGGVLLDLGCAFGYLVGEARERGYRAFGLDVSTYALRQEPDLQPWLGQSNVEQLPLRDRSCDVITLFDALEHLEDPLACLEESARVLAPEGLLLGATPDPIFFPGEEATHRFERPPSFWIDALSKLGFITTFRFSEKPYNFQFAAAFPGTETGGRLNLLQHDYFSDQPDVVAVRGPLTAVLRSGWGARSDSGRTLQQETASVYLLNTTRHPLRLHVEASGCCREGAATLRLRLNSYSLAEAHLHPVHSEYHFEVSDVLLPSGGHHLFFDRGPSGSALSLRSLKITAAPAAAEDLTAGLPFDLYQRYQLVGEVAKILAPARILDVGGYLGDAHGHIATCFDFLGASRDDEALPSVVTTDVRPCDVPNHSVALAWRQGFPDGAFDMVVSLDVLEHLPPDRRLEYLLELDRLSQQWIVVGAPFADPLVDEAEERLAAFMGSQRFLQEHRELGLPAPSLMQEAFASKGYEIIALPSGYLPRWFAMQVLTQHYFGMKDYAVIQSLNRLYNKACFSSDRKSPSYRLIFLVAKAAVTDVLKQRLHSLADREGEASFVDSALIHDDLFLRMHEQIAGLFHSREKGLQDVQFLFNEQQKLIGFLERELQLLRGPLWKVGLRRLRGKLRRFFARSST